MPDQAVVADDHPTLVLEGEAAGLPVALAGVVGLVLTGLPAAGAVGALTAGRPAAARR